MSKVVTLSNFTGELDFMTTFTSAHPLTLRVGLGLLRILILMFISLIIHSTTKLLVVLWLSGIHH